MWNIQITFFFVRPAIQNPNIFIWPSSRYRIEPANILARKMTQMIYKHSDLHQGSRLDPYHPQNLSDVANRQTNNPWWKHNLGPHVFMKIINTIPITFRELKSLCLYTVCLHSVYIMFDHAFDIILSTVYIHLFNFRFPVQTLNYKTHFQAYSFCFGRNAICHIINWSKWDCATNAYLI